MSVLGRAYRRILGHPFVYNQVRPRVVGGIDMRPLYDRLAGERHAILDIGCGTGDALRYLDDFESYVGYDTDPVAIEFAQKTYGARPGVRFACGMITAREIAEIAPTAGILAGVLHHLSDDEARTLLEALRASPRLRRVVTQDIVYVPHMTFNNVFARLDRGRYCRPEGGYQALARDAGLGIDQADVVPSHPKNKRIVYFMMTLTPPKM
jgi:SAM-dependent methyltransferase